MSRNWSCTLNFKAWLALCTAFLVACAPTKDPFGMALREGRVTSLDVPESLSVDLSILPSRKGSTPFSARLYVRPHRQYRLDAIGFSSIAASYLWTGSTGSPQAGGHWILLLNEKRESWEGEGDSLNLESAALRIPDVHVVLGFLWGETLPGFHNRDDSVLAWSGDTLRWSSHGIHWVARFDASTGNCLQVSTSDGSLEFKYAKHQRFDASVLPGEVEVFVNGESMLLLHINRVETHPAWKRDPFALTVPASYKRLHPE